MVPDAHVLAHYMSLTQMTSLIQRAPRYFDYSESNWLACNEFSGDDDKSNKGKAKKRRKTCYICGDINHSGTPCLKVSFLWTML